MTEVDIVKIEKYFPVFEACIRGGISDYSTIEKRRIFEAWSRAGVIRDLIVNRIKNCLYDDPNCRFIEKNGRFMLQISGINIQFKKLGKNLRSSYIPTIQALRFNNQLSLFGLPQKSINLIAGYVMDFTSGLSKVFLVQPFNKSNEWVLELGEADQSFFNIEETNTPPPMIPQPKLILKKPLRKVQNE